jgi:hypothetical protein
LSDQGRGDWQRHPRWLKWWFWSNYASFRPSRAATQRVIWMCFVSGIAFCLLGIWALDALLGALVMLALAALFQALLRQGDRHGVWVDCSDRQDD